MQYCFFLPFFSILIAYIFRFFPIFILLPSKTYIFYYGNAGPPYSSSKRPTHWLTDNPDCLWLWGLYAEHKTPKTGLDNWIMQFESFHWLTHHGLWAIIPWSANMVSKRVILGAFLFLVKSFFYILGVFLIKQLFHLHSLDMRLVIVNSALRASLAIYHLISNARSWNNC